MTRKSHQGGKRLIRNALAESQGDPVVAYMAAVDKKRAAGEGHKKIKVKKKIIKRAMSISA